jgi:hypothetical protein
MQKAAQGALSTNGDNSCPEQKALPPCVQQERTDTEPAVAGAPLSGAEQTRALWGLRVNVSLAPLLAAAYSLLPLPAILKLKRNSADVARKRSQP